MIESFLIHYDRVTSFSAPGYLTDEILLFLNNGQDQFIKDKVFGQNFQPPAFEDNQKRVVDILPLVRRSLITSGSLSPQVNYGASSYGITKLSIESGRVLYAIDIEARVTRTEPVATEQYYRCDRIKHEYVGKFTQSNTNKTHYLYPKVTEDKNYYYIICDSYTTLVDAARLTVVVMPYPITNSISDYNGTYGSGYMSLKNEVHQEIVDIAVQQALQTISDPRWQTKVNQEQIDTN